MTPDLSAIRARAEAHREHREPDHIPAVGQMIAGHREPNHFGELTQMVTQDIPALLAEIERLQSQAALEEQDLRSALSKVLALDIENARLQSLLAPLKGESAEIVMRELRRLQHVINP